MKNSDVKAKANTVTEKLKEMYPDAECALQAEGDPYRLLVMARLSAQCTDKRVNEVCVGLFARYPDCESMAAAPVEEIERLIYSCGLYKTKAKSIKEMSEKLLSEYGGKVPSEMSDLLTLPGVGRKIANLIRGDVYGMPAIVADTHCIRIAARLGLCGSDGKPTSPEMTERQLLGVIAPEESSDFCHRIVLFGRDICSSRSPACDRCPFIEICLHKKEAEKC